MRPRHKAAENESSDGLKSIAFDASMRPRHKAAENSGAVECDGYDHDSLQ